MRYHAEIRFVGAPCSASDYEVVWSGAVVEVDQAWRNHVARPQRDSTGHGETVSSAVLNHQVVIIDEAGREFGLDDAPDAVIAEFTP